MHLHISFFWASFGWPIISHLFQHNWYAMVIGPVGIVVRRHRHYEWSA